MDGPAAHGSESNRRGRCPGERPRLGALRSAEGQGAPDPGNLGVSVSFWWHWVFVAALGLFLVAGSGASPVAEHGL